MTVVNRIAHHLWFLKNSREIVVGTRRSLSAMASGE